MGFPVPIAKSDSKSTRLSPLSSPPASLHFGHFPSPPSHAVSSTLARRSPLQAQGVQQHGSSVWLRLCHFSHPQGPVAGPEHGRDRHSHLAVDNVRAGYAGRAPGGVV